MGEPFLQNHRLVISTLSPVHIGCGVDYEPTNYLMDEGTLFTFDPVTALCSDDSARTELLNIVNQQQGERVVRAIQRFFLARKDQLIPLHIRRIPVGEGVQTFYDERIGNQTKPNRLHIERMAFSALNDQIVLPGSSLKGAIRTALLDGVHGGMALENPTDAENRIDWKRLAPIPRTLGNALPQQFERDPMRLIRVGDTRLNERDTHNEILFAVNRRPSGGEGHGPYQTLECLSPLALESFVTDISFLNLEQARRYDQSAEKKGLPLQELLWNDTNVVRQCNRYYRAHLQRELEELKGMLDPRWADTIWRSLESGAVGRLLDKGRAFLLRVGRHSGAESVTLNGARHIKIKLKSGFTWGPRATTVWLAARNDKQEKDLLPFGWVLAELDDGDGARPPLEERAPELAELARRYATDRAKALETSDAKLRQLQQQSENNRMEEERRQAELAHQAAERKALQERLDAMSPNQRLLHKLKGLIAQEKHTQPFSGSLYMEANKLLSAAEKESWSHAELQELARLCHAELPGKLKDAGKKLKEIHLRLDNLLSAAP